MAHYQLSELEYYTNKFLNTRIVIVKTNIAYLYCKMVVFINILRRL